MAIVPNKIVKIIEKTVNNALATSILKEYWNPYTIPQGIDNGKSINVNVLINDVPIFLPFLYFASKSE